MFFGYPPIHIALLLLSIGNNNCFSLHCIWISSAFNAHFNRDNLLDLMKLTDNAILSHNKSSYFSMEIQDSQDGCIARITYAQSTLFLTINLLSPQSAIPSVDPLQLLLFPRSMCVCICVCARARVCLGKKLGVRHAAVLLPRLN